MWQQVILFLLFGVSYIDLFPPLSFIQGFLFILVPKIYRLVHTNPFKSAITVVNSLQIFLLLSSIFI